MTVTPSRPFSRLSTVPLGVGGQFEMLVSTEPDARFALHAHPEWSVGAIVEGECRFVCAGQSCRAPAGAMVLMPPGAMHTAGTSPGRFRMVMLYVPQDWLAARLGWPGGQRPAMRQIAWADPLLAAELMAAAVADVQRLPALVERIIGDQATDQLVPVQPLQPDLRIQQVCELLQATDACDLDLGALAATLGVTREHFHRLFRQAVGLAPAQYARLARIAKAKNLLGEGYSVADTAAHCGFADQSHFSRWFRRCFGVSPARYGRVDGPG